MFANTRSLGCWSGEEGAREPIVGPRQFPTLSRTLPDEATTFGLKLKILCDWMHFGCEYMVKLLIGVVVHVGNKGWQIFA